MLHHGDMATTGNPLTPVVLPRDRGTPVDRELERARRFAAVLDRYLVDPVLGLVLPGAGDVLGSLFGMYTIALAFRRKLSPVVIARMFLNLGLDAVFGIVPLAGDLVDVGFQAHTRNVALLAERRTGKATAKDWAIVAGAALLFVVALGLCVWAIVAAVRALA